MRPRSQASPTPATLAVGLRLLGLLLVLGGLSGGAIALLAGSVAVGTPDRSDGLSDPQTAVTWVAAVAVLGCVAWLDLVTLLVAVEVLRDLRRPTRGHPRPRRLPVTAGHLVVPPAWRRLVLTTCGVLALGTPTAQAAQADPTDPAQPPAPPRVAPGAHPLAGLVLPDRVASPASGATRDGRPAPRRVTVRPGDSLWALTEGLLPPEASAGAVARGWRLLYRANRRAVGPDPHLIRPGLSLRVPPSLTARGARR